MPNASSRSGPREQAVRLAGIRDIPRSEMFAFRFVSLGVGGDGVRRLVLNLLILLNDPPPYLQLNQQTALGGAGLGTEGQRKFLLPWFFSRAGLAAVPSGNSSRRWVS